MLGGLLLISCRLMSLELPFELTVHRRSGLSLECIEVVGDGGLDIGVTPIGGVGRVLIYSAAVSTPINDTRDFNF